MSPTWNAVFSDGDTADPDVLKKLRLVQGPGTRIKVLAKGSLAKKLTVEAHAFSEKARAQIEAAGGTVKQLEIRDSAALARTKRNSAKSRQATSRPSRLEKKRSTSTNE